jgi:hypothetical protein
MTPGQSKDIEYLWKQQEAAHKALQAMADHMANLVTNKVKLTQDRWDELNRSWEATQKQAARIGEALRKLHGIK